MSFQRTNNRALAKCSATPIDVLERMSRAQAPKLRTCKVIRPKPDILYIGSPQRNARTPEKLFMTDGFIRPLESIRADAIASSCRIRPNFVTNCQPEAGRTGNDAAEQNKRRVLYQGRVVREDEICRRLMTIPGVGPVVPRAFCAIIDIPMRFGNSKAIGPALGLTPILNQSGESRRKRQEKQREGIVESSQCLCSPTDDLTRIALSHVPKE